MDTLAQDKIQFFDYMLYKSYYSAEIASTGHTSAHDPQSVHNSGSIT